jgi:hypothetical protein
VVQRGDSRKEILPRQSAQIKSSPALATKLLQAWQSGGNRRSRKARNIIPTPEMNAHPQPNEEPYPPPASSQREEIYSSPFKGEAGRGMGLINKNAQGNRYSPISSFTTRTRMSVLRGFFSMMVVTRQILCGELQSEQKPVVAQGVARSSRFEFGGAA